MDRIPAGSAARSRRAALVAAPWLLAGLLGSATAALGADLVVQGCNELLPGEVGVREAVGNVGEFLEVPITLNAMSDVDAFGLELQVPAGVLSYVRTDRGDLTSGFELFGGNWFGSTSRVRIVAGGNGAIPSGSIGRLATVVFQVVAAGSGAFSTVTEGFTDDLAGYVSCEDVHGTNRIPPSEWGQVKALYRSGP